MRIKTGKSLRYYCKMPNPIGNGEYIYIDNGSDVLGVVHLDMHPNIARHVQKFRQDGNIVYSVSLDDRLGLYTMLNLLPKLGIVTDILFTTNEEIGQSTAQFFMPTKDYNWLYQFDRRGDGVVMYDYETPELCDIMQTYNFRIDRGSFSDICYLNDMGVAGFNFGTGYYNEHTLACYADLSILDKQVSKFAHFYNDYKNIKLSYMHDASAYIDDDLLCDYCNQWYADIYYLSDIDATLCLDCIEYLNL